MASDYFDEAIAIHNGERDRQMPKFEELKQWLGRVPQTWLPSLLRQVVACCVSKNVFQQGAIMEFVARCEEQARTPPSVFRAPESATTEPNSEHG